MSFNTIKYLEGRRECLRAQAQVYESESVKARCAQARLSEVCELLIILEHQKRRTEAIESRKH